ncbi:MAG: transporter substrate-binding domain-containing protein [Deltaproteobacteria bacterium]|nr:transporter substrate-binding domain-containing protein [Deltaproteobacteria bacterium]
MSAKWLKYGVVILLFFTPVTVSAQQNVNTGSHSVEPDAITIASEPDYPPYCMVDENGHADGFSVDLFKAAAKAVGLRVKIKIGVWNKIKLDLADGRIDALPLVGRTPEREKLFDFTLPYLSLHGAVFVREGTSGINTLEDLQNREIAVMKGDNAEEFVQREKISKNIFTTHTFEEAFKELAAGKYDAVITQRLMGLELLKKTGIDSVKPLDIQLPKFRQDFCFAVQKGNKNLLARLNEGLSIVIANDTYEEIRLKWFGPVIKEKIAFKDILKIILYAIIPILIILSGISIIVLRKEVKRQTKNLINEIAERKKTEKALRENEAELRNMSGKLEDQVAERTTELQEKVKKLDKSQQAMLYMVEDLNRITAELKEERRKLELSNKELEAFSYSVSHDLRAPLRSIDGFSQALLEEYQERLDNTGKTYLERVRKATQRMGLLIDDMLKLSKITRTEMNHGTINLSGMIREIAAAHQKNNTGRAVDVTVQEGIMVQGDSYLIRIAMENLVNNAFKFTGKEAHPRIEFGTAIKDGKTACFIRDNGAGFDMTYVDKLFGAFQRLHTSDEFPGTGIGLATVQRIIHRHGCQVWAEGEIGKGTTFYFTLPSQVIGS